MTEPTQDPATAYATALLSHYGFELGGYTAQELVAMWLHRYRANWVRLAVIEALYQGRYKAVSVEQILAAWNRRARPIYHFNHEFERLISRKIPQNIAAAPDAPSVIENNTYDPASFLLDPEVLEENIGIGSNASLAHQKAPTPATLDITKTPTDSEALGDLTAAAHYRGERSFPGQSLGTRERAGLGYRHTGASLDLEIETFNSAAVNASPEKADIPLSSNPDRDIRDGEDEGKGKGAIYETDWEQWDLSNRSIHQFMPTPDKSDFYLKLKAVAQHRQDFVDDAATKSSDRQ